MIEISSVKSAQSQFMFCPKCARENLDRNKFCNGCGTSLAVETIPAKSFIPPPPPPPKARVAAEQPKDLKPPHSSFVEGKADGKSTDNLSVSETVQSANAESLTGKVSANGKSAAEPAEFSAFSPAQKTLSEQITPSHKTQTGKTFNDYLSEVESKYRATQVEQQKNTKTHLIVGAAAAVLIILGSLIAVGWYFMSRRETVPEVVAENKNTSAEKTNINQPPSPPPEMVYIAGGEFMMGSNSGDEYSRPAHRVSVKPFYIDKTEVTCEEYKKFVDATGHMPPPVWQNNDFPPGAARKPVTGVTWDHANAFAKWKNKRLPTEEEWEFAARSTDGRIYPWGNVWKPEMANADKQKIGVQEVGLSGGQSPFGVFDMSGNAWEWTSSEAKAYPNGKSFETKSLDPKVIRGGFWGSDPEGATAIYRGAWGARNEKDYKNTGFRCAKDFP